MIWNARILTGKSDGLTLPLTPPAGTETLSRFMSFTPLDYAVLTFYLVASAAFGMWIGRGQKDLEGYFLGNRRMPGWAISFSIVATETSTLTFIGAPAISYAGDLTFLQVAAGYLIGKILVAYVLIPSFFKGRLNTAYEVLQNRFGPSVRTAGAALFQITRCLADGVRLFATALVLTVVTGISDAWAVLLIGGITVVYTLYGGMKAVVWNDVIQLILYLFGAALAFVLLIQSIPGGLAEAARMAPEKWRVFDFAWTFGRPYTFWGGMIGGAFLTFATHGTDHMLVQRYLSCGDPKASRRALIASGAIVLAQFALFLGIGLLLHAFYTLHPLTQPLERADRVFPIFIVQQMPPGVSGLIIAAIFAAAMSTLSSSLNALASSTVNDFLGRRLKPDLPSQLRLSRWMTLAWGAALVGVSFVAKRVDSVLEAGLTIAGVTMGSVLGLFLLARFFPRCSSKAALAGMFCGLAAMLWVYLGTDIAWTWYVVVGTSVTLAVGGALSLASRRGHAEEEKR